MSDLKAIEYKRFEDIKHINENGSESDIQGINDRRGNVH